MNFKYKYFTMETYNVGLMKAFYLWVYIPILGSFRVSLTIQPSGEDSFILFRTTNDGKVIIYLKYNNEDGLTGKYVKFLTRGGSNG